MICIQGTSIATTWLTAMERLIEAGGDTFSLVACIDRPLEPEGKETDLRRHVDRALLNRGLQDTQTVANTIFPVDLARNRTASDLFDVYRNRAWPVLRRVQQNRRGTYFLRMIERAGYRREVTFNPLAALIGKINREVSRGTGIVRSSYELAVYDPRLDRTMRMSFPCLSHVSLKIDSNESVIHLSAIYRNQTFFDRALGNYLGLARLQAFVARETGLAVGSLVCHATHAEVGALGKRASRSLAEECRRLFQGAELAAGLRQAGGVPGPD